MSDNQFPVPKNIRQIGAITGNKKIYVEDYVSTYVKQLTKAEPDRDPVGVLLGRISREGEETHIFVVGAVTIPNASFLDGNPFQGNAWSGINENIQQYFNDLEIVGWITTNDMQTDTAGGPYLETHMRYFAGENQVLLLYDRFEQELNFYMNQMGRLLLQPGYYIYYEKNENMQNYMVDTKEGSGCESGFEDTTARKIRQVLEQKPEDHPERKIKPADTGEARKDVNRILKQINHNMDKPKTTSWTERLAYSFSVVMIGVFAVMAVTLFRQSTEMGQLKQTVDALSNQAQEEPATSGTIVDSVPGNLQEITVPPENEEDAETTTESAEKETETEEKTEKETEKEAEKETEKKETEKETKQDSGKETKEKEASSSQSKKVYYTVKAGDTLGSIAVKLGKPYSYLNEIMEANDMEDPDTIIEGQKLILP